MDTLLLSRIQFAITGVPMVLAYTACIYWVFRGKVKLDVNSD